LDVRGLEQLYFEHHSSSQALLDAILQDKNGFFINAAYAFEQVQLWEEYFPFRHVDLNVGKELTLYKNPLSEQKTRKFIRSLSHNLDSPRFFTKQPWNTFRIHVLRQIFPDAKIVAIHRDGRDVISSWGRRADRWNKFGGYEKAIPLFAQKWRECIEHIEKHKEELDIYVLRYEDLLQNHISELQKLFDFCELSYSHEIYDSISLKSNVGQWKTRVPSDFYSFLESHTQGVLKQLNYC
jgi:Sulfotransferase family